MKKSNIRAYFHPILVICGVLMLFFVLGCSTQKNTFVNRNYHSITTKYNGYFNARESYREGLRRLAQLHEDNYEDVLSVFKYGSEQQMRTISGNMEIAYQKASTAIRRHSMNIRGVEYNRWIDDSYYLIARSHYFKRDVNLAILTFEYIIRQFDSPLQYKSKIWVAKSYIQAGQFDNSQQALLRATADKEQGLLDREALMLYNMVYADFHLKQNQYAQAAPYLERASQLAPNRRMRTRMAFIQAQAYHKAENFAQAQQAYARVLKLNPDFQMAFQARINMAMAFDTRSGDARFIQSELEGMLRDNKNREFRDQIYFALGQFSMRQNKVDQALEYYQLSLDNFRGNRSQKGITFLRMGEIHLDRKDYRTSARLYDSTMVYLSREYPEYEAAGKKNVLLRELAAQMRITQREDSLQRLAALSVNERNAILDQIIADLQEKERQERELEQERARMRQEMARHGQRGMAQGMGDGGWYFYNPSAMSFGRNEFFAKWGERELADLWRISNKQILAFGETPGMGEDDPDQLQGGRVNRAALLENIPTTPEKMQLSNSRMSQAYYTKGMIFKDRFRDIPNAISSFETVINRFPQSDNRLFSLYFLYNLYENQGNTNRAQAYKDMIIREFPDTDFARILSDPNYAENVRQRQNRVKELYAQAYDAFLAGNYSYALDLVSQSETMEKNLEQQAQFFFLKALVVGKTSDTGKFIHELTYVTENFQGTRVHEPAQNLLAFLGTSLPETAQAETESRDGRRQRGDGQATAVESSIFTYKPEAVHFHVLVVNTRRLQIRQLRSDINAFNRENFAENNLNISTLFFDEGRQLITITNFADAQKAYDYSQALKAAMIQKGHNTDHYNGLIISVDNYPVFYQERKLKEYEEFFEAVYNFGN